MARLSGVDLPREKRLEIALTYIYGIGKTRAHATLAATGVSGDVRVRDLSDADVVALRDDDGTAGRRIRRTGREEGAGVVIAVEISEVVFEMRCDLVHRSGHLRRQQIYHFTI